MKIHQQIKYKAVNSRIGILLYSETLINGMLLTAVGLILGLLLAAIIANFPENLLKKKIIYFAFIKSFFHLNSVIWIVLFVFAFLFVVVIFLVHKFVHQEAEHLIEKDKLINKTGYPVLARVFEAIFGIALLGGGYCLLVQSVENFLMNAFLSFIAILSGTYFLLHALLNIWLGFGKNRAWVSWKVVHLQFCLHNYTRILTEASMFFAMALGAFTLNFSLNSFIDGAEKGMYYDGTIVSNSPLVRRKVSELIIKDKQTFHYKETAKEISFNRDEFQNNPLKYIKTNKNTYQLINLKTRKLVQPKTQAHDVFMDMIPNGRQKTIRLIAGKDWTKGAGKNQFITFLRVKSFKRDWPKLLNIEKLQAKKNKGFQFIYQTGKPMLHRTITVIVNGLRLISLCFSLVFLIMAVAQVLSRSKESSSSYQNLWQTEKRAPLYPIFVLSGLLGVFDVLFGLRQFDQLMPDTYYQCWIPLLIGITIYLFLTLLISKKINRNE